MNDDTEVSKPAATVRTVEMAVAALAFLFGVIVIADSLRLGAGWSDDGPQAGYFPFYIGLVICASSAWTLWTDWRKRHTATEVFVTRSQLKQIFALLLPATVYVIAIAFVGIYVASLVFMAYFMVRHGEHRWWTTAAVAIGLPAVLFLMFEVWFKTPLPKGPLEALLGLN